MEFKIHLLTWITIQLVIVLVLQSCFQQAAGSLLVRTRRDAETTTGAPATEATTAADTTTAKPAETTTPAADASKTTASPDDAASKAVGKAAKTKKDPKKGPKSPADLTGLFKKSDSLDFGTKQNFGF